MLAAAEQVAGARLTHPVYITCTADEEVGYGGARQVAARSQLYREMVTGGSRGIIGEPTCLEVVHAHKGTYGLKAIARGRAAHSSTGEGLNANLAMIPFLAELLAIHTETESDPRWRDDRFSPPTQTWNIGINDHTRAVNITAPQSICTAYFRPMPGQEPEGLIERARRKAEACGLEFAVTLRGKPVFISPEAPFVRECLEIAGRKQPTTVAYSTDGAMFGELQQMIVCGPGDIRQAHTHDEWIALVQLEQGTDLYRRMIDHWCRT
jgi:acetylornithine deacetylase